jgi:hypothetical protein
MQISEYVGEPCAPPEHHLDQVTAKISFYGGRDGGNWVQSCCGTLEEGEATDEGVRRVP